MKQYEAVIATLERLGGVATLGELNKEVFKIKECEWKTKTPFASIRRIVQVNENIYKIKPGLWALKSHQKELEARGIVVETERNRNSNEVKEFTHSYYQGLLVELGNMMEKKTFVPNQDKSKLFVDKKLGEIRSLQDIPHYSYDNIVNRSSTIDVIWFNERIMPECFFEVEHSTDIQNSLLKYADLIDFNTKMFIVADERRKAEYEKKMNYTSFSYLCMNKRVEFLSYSKLEKRYNIAVEKASLSND